MDDVEHTVFDCSWWDIQRWRCRDKLEKDVTPDNIVQIMLQNQESWTTIVEYVTEIIGRKEEDEREVE